MKIKWGALVVDGRNKIGGHVASKNRAGSYLRTKVTPVNPSTTYQSNVRSRLASFSAGWRALGAATIALWNNAVQDFKSTDIFGDIKSPTGFNLWQRLSNNIDIVTGTPLTTPPVPTAIACFTSLSATAVHAGAVTLTFTVTPVPTAIAVKIFATPAISVGINFVKSQYRLIGVIDAAGASPFVATSLYNTKFGAVGAAGKKIYFKAVHVGKTTGQTSRPVVCSAVIS